MNAPTRRPVVVRQRLEPQDLAAVERIVAAATAADGVKPLNEAAWLGIRRGAGSGTHLLGQGPDGPVGYGFLAPGGDPVVDPLDGEVVVDPEHRQHGWGWALLAAAVEVAGRRDLRVWSHGDHPDADRMAARAGFDRARELWRMRRPLGPDVEPLAEVPQVPGVSVRTFRPGQDEDAWLALNARAFAQHPEQGRTTRADLDERMAQPWFDPDGFFLAERDGRPVGFHWTKVHSSGSGEVYVVGVDPEAQGAGVGRLVTLAGLHHLQAVGVPDVLLYVEAGNPAAVSMYQRLGFERVGTEVMYLHRGQPSG